MLTRIKIENYRGFRSYELGGLTTVNLLVGKNNSGKTALLEGIDLAASGGDPWVLVTVADRRGEAVAASREGAMYLDLSHFFHGRDVKPGSRFSIVPSDGATRAVVSVVPLDEVERQAGLDGVFPERPAYSLSIEGWRPDSKGGGWLPLSIKGALMVDASFPRRQLIGEPRRKGGRPSVFLTPDSAEPESLGQMWDQVLRNKQEEQVRAAMQILEPNLEDIVFQTAPVHYRPYDRPLGRAGVLISFRGDQLRVPLGSLGDGMRRLLALSICLSHAKGGYLLIDEIDTGLHYSIMAKMWELVVRTARDSGTQVFATTHSADCVRGLGVLCKASPGLQQDVAAHKIDPELAEAVSFSGAEVVQTLEQDIEIR